MASEEDRKPWQRLPGEGVRPYAAFVIYRNMPSGARSIREACRLFLTIEPASNAPAALRQFRRYKTHPHPEKYLRNLANMWRRWSKYWQWVGRCKSFDEHMQDLAQVDREAAALRVAQAEIAELEAQAKARLTTFRLGRQVVTVITQRLAKAIQDGALDETSAEKLVTHLSKLTTLLDVCSKHERTELTRPVQKAGPDGKVAEPGPETNAESMSDEELGEYVRSLFAS